ncbi:MAG: RdgB/HAM1 family non-canonical purine NTP pyrophosphatase [Lentisphaerae bacterium]|nr:RdgB/HAM1 family non-canonical purine NTP pyrophosphatase [Lentisphaerota bacterium]
MKLLVSTRNPHKLDELLAIVARPGLVLLSMREFPDLPEVIEDGETFDANARKKAVTLALATGHWTLGDDSGLEVPALGGEPGVYSARYAGEPVSYPANNAKLLARLGDGTDRRARFRCVLALSDPSGHARTVEGRCEGVITEAPRGTHGFGYDPVFVPEGHHQTFAELDPAYKNKISHRAAALRAADAAWGDVFAGGVTSFA